jgi:peptidoglycan hydrolase-like protein with peptidoglycan-binding domain
MAALVRGSNAWRLAEWGEPCALTPVGVAIYEGGPRFQCHPLARDAVALLGAVFVRHGYIVRRIGGYNCRRITGGSSMSSHAWGISVDVNDDTNPYRTDRLQTDMPDAMIADVLAIRTREGVPVWRWGGNWDGLRETPHSNYDAMHFELVATPRELAAGFDALVPVRPDPAAPLTVRAFPTLRRGMTGPAVLMFQSLVGLERVSGAGQFGPRTEAAARAYQSSRGLDVDGVVGFATWHALLHNWPPHDPAMPLPRKPRSPEPEVAP